MSKKVKTVLKVLLSILFLLTVLAYIFLPPREGYFGWVEITHKDIEDDRYYISAEVGEKSADIVIAIDKTETFVYVPKPGESIEVTFSQVWNTVETNRKYFVKIESSKFSSEFKLEKLYGYLSSP